MASAAADTNPEYWAEYTNLQQVKHDLIRCYLGGWFAKLGFWAGRVVYLDTHAGRGAYATGHLGSPLVALDTLLTHHALDQLLKKSEFRFLFIERDLQRSRELTQGCSPELDHPASATNQRGTRFGRTTPRPARWLR
jgi:three-Cys-motif partner protein